MAENRTGCCGTSSGTDQVYVDVDRILDSCRDKDCFEDVRVFLTCAGQEVIERTGSIRTKCCNIVGTNIIVSPLSFNNGFYQVTIRIYCRCVFECCTAPCRPQEIEGIAVVEKNVILYGGERGVKTFRSPTGSDNFCCLPDFNNGCDNGLPTAVLDIADPVVLSTKIVERCNCKCCCCCTADDIPESVLNTLSSDLVTDDSGSRYLVLSLGFFSVVRLEREAQYIMRGTEYSVPEKECVFDDSDDPCCVFRRMSFPVDQFTPNAENGSGSCGCNDNHNSKGCCGH